MCPSTPPTSTMRRTPTHITAVLTDQQRRRYRSSAESWRGGLDQAPYRPAPWLQPVPSVSAVNWKYGEHRNLLIRWASGCLKTAWVRLLCCDAVCSKQRRTLNLCQHRTHGDPSLDRSKPADLPYVCKKKRVRLLRRAIRRARTGCRQVVPSGTVQARKGACRFQTLPYA
ncbi:hypothetical protein BI312_13215 [Xanthomonas citri pv. citri]|uniref:Uncharacterized protein n=1 Tax=Xanthomonas axonopodis pv. citri (strain 306) TaxID=190486 RepID=A0AAI7ZJ89_XANAC|nr:hypothetical protein XAC4356 [Xanthomonas citri pv. citri str. 306]AGH79766.1 hypothetical protein XAC29_21925 [Xanthomonas axonopodis Xac29-1]APR09112.1 hypothetical protein BI314_01750 [Xanthomonas citri pv. citri]QYF47298.1 hypothetical protein HZS93_04684 [Xanthomonas citri]APR15644.1 hypothetical protein BI315_13155 [Xanthomonas citri pv. citri]